MTKPQRRHALVTGGTNGIGYQIARLLGARDYQMILVGRDPKRGEAARQRLRDDGVVAEFIAADLASMADVHRVAAAISNRIDRIDLLVHSAGAVHGGRRLTPDGIDVNFAVNYLARFVLMEQLEPLLVSSQDAAEPTILFINGGPTGAPIRYRDIERGRAFGTIKGVQQYCSANDLLALGMRYDGLLASKRPVRVGCLKLGPVKTDIRRTFPVWMRILVPLLLDPWLTQTPEDAASAAQTVIDRIQADPAIGPLFSKLRALRPMRSPLTPADASQWRTLFTFSHQLASRSQPS
ncbi:MAG TPA: SDR family NAD(P)-dependent oxidoreductase [Gemmatimonadaceae bacterium]|nr:SDR family NAD(P)-dependent oxidoreductase [Gemmatimonadaceae bacterium]